MLFCDFFFSYHGYDACNNVFYTVSDDIVFHIAGLGISYNRSTHKQSFYNGHTDDILCLTVHDDKNIVATGQVCTRFQNYVFKDNRALCNGMVSW